MKTTLLLTLLFLFSIQTFAKDPSGSKEEKAILSGGCFWGMEEVFRKIPGVTKTEVGYTGHAESIEITFDPKTLSYENLLKTFFRAHDPTSKDRQGNDVGTQYRSSIFYLDEKQKITAEEVVKMVDKSKKWPKPVVTEVMPAKTFYPAEDYHQKYLIKNPHGYNDHYLRDFKF